MSASTRWRLSVPAVLAVAGLLLSGCTKKANHPPPSVSPSNSSAPASSSPLVSAAPSTASPAAAVLPTACSQLLPLGALQRILGFGILGQVTYLRAAPVPQSGRTGRVTCGYGAPKTIASGTASPGATAKPAAPPLVQASYITYVDAKTAASRVQSTVEADAASAVVTEATVDGLPASILLGSQSSELVMSDGARTLVVVLQPLVVAADKAPAALKAIAALMLQFDRPAQSGSASGSPGSASSTV
ncbi:MAG: hypothetical protein QOC73_813 [Actinomycetota bacterium]|nr:hypothetical protein [Actinomycetota bacterium]